MAARRKGSTKTQSRVLTRRPRATPPQGWGYNEEVIRARAYQLWQRDPTRSPEDNWRQAEAELYAATGAPEKRQTASSIGAR